MLMLAMDWTPVGIAASFISATGLGAAALWRTRSGDKALKETTNVKSLWDQTNTVITGLQEQVDSYRLAIDKCEEGERRGRAEIGLVNAELAALKLDHLKLVLKLERIESQP